MSKPKKPKALKMPKRPKQSASVTVWENYERRRKETVAKNKKRLSDYKKAINKIESDKKKKASIISRTR